MPRDLIAAVATPAGAGGIGIVRASGGNVSPLAALLAAGRLPPPRQAVRSGFLDEAQEAIDSGLALYFRAPHSFTGEDVLELHAHGGAVVMQRLLARCVQLGARLAQPGEFTLRAYLNSKIDLAQAEAVADLINAGSAAAAKAAARSLAGEFSAVVEDFTQRLRRARVAIESELDFSEEDISGAPAAAGQLPPLLAALEQLIGRAQQGVRLASGVDVVIAGAPNVGKSSLLNRLAGEEAAIVSGEAGTTRDLVERQIVVDGLVMRATDTAGLHDAAAPVEQEGIRRARQRLQQADIVLCVSTAGAPLPPLPDLQAAQLKICNKIDLSGEAAGERGGVHYLSAKTGAGMDELRRALCAAAGYAPDTSAFSARGRHVAALCAARDCVRQAAESALPEVAAAWLRDADGHLQAISGGYSEEDLLGEIFSTFCIGK